MRKYLRDDTGEPAFKVPERASKLDAFADKLSAWFRAESIKSRKQKRTIKQLHADLGSLGYDGFLWPGGRFCERLEIGPAARTADERPRNLRAAGVRAR